MTPVLFLALAAAALAMLVFSPGLGGGFVLDDVQTIVDNSFIRVTTLNLESWLEAAASFSAGQGSRPLAMLSFAFDFWRHGSLDAATFKETSVFIHGLTTFALALFFRRLLMLADWAPQRASMVAALLALAWAVHPIQVSAVLYVVQRMQTLATLFLVLALWAYLGLRQAQVEGQRGWPQGILAAVCWLLALASKEDAIMLPIYCLLLEFFILRFKAAEEWRAHSLRRAYLVVLVAGTALFLFWLVPTTWSWEPYHGREFNSMERLLTQARVLALYLGQILWPLPSRFPFNYDTFEVSRDLLQPLSTLPAMVLALGLLAWAWCWRTRRPVFALGIGLFFAGHFVTSNIIGLEMVFEHRNQIPLIGIVLALADLLIASSERWHVNQAALRTTATTLLLTVAICAGYRAYQWGDAIRMAEYHVCIQPDSPRAWLALGGTYFDLAGRKNGKGSPYLSKAIEIMETAADKTAAPSAYSNIVIYKTIAGTVTQTDWDRLLHRVATAPMTPANVNILWNSITNLRAKIGLDESQALELIKVISQRSDLSANEQLYIGLFIYNKTSSPDAALDYFLNAAKKRPNDDPTIVGLRRHLTAHGHSDWADAIQSAGLQHTNAASN